MRYQHIYYIMMEIKRLWYVDIGIGQQHQLIKSRLESRLDLENSLVYGMLRLILFCSIVVLMVQVTSFGKPPKDKRAISLLLAETLGLVDFLSLRRACEICRVSNCSSLNSREK